MTTAVLFVLFFLFTIGMPIAFTLLAVAMVMSFFFPFELPLLVIPQNMSSGVESFTLLAVPLFILTAKIMNAANITHRVFDFARSIVGNIPGGLAHVNILASLIFAGMSGAAIADAAGLGEIEIKAMRDDGYDAVFSAAITGGSSIIGPIFPPSIPILLYGSLVGVSVGKLFLAGMIPGCTMALLLFVPAYVISIRRKYPYIPFPGIGPFLRGVAKGFARGIFPLFTPIIILGSIMFGIATPTEAAVLAVLYSLGLGFFYKSIHLKDIPKIFLEAAVDSAIVLFIVSAVSAFSWMLTSKEIPQTLTNFIFNALGDPTIVIIAIIGLLVILGLFMNPTPGLLLSVPLLLPVAQKLQMDLVQFGVMIVLTLAIGLLTPPVGLVLYIVANIANVEVGDLIKELLPFIIALLLVVFLVAFVPSFTLMVPNFFYGG